jgi:uncharacterized 2Fe-2S/4Fe-4S cluster protein (DUF4445 family)
MITASMIRNCKKGNKESLLSFVVWGQIKEIANLVGYIELAKMPSFNRKFAEAIYLQVRLNRLKNLSGPYKPSNKASTYLHPTRPDCACE